MCFKMAERFNPFLDNILSDWANDKVQTSLAEELNRFERQEEERYRLACHLFVSNTF